MFFVVAATAFSGMFFQTAQEELHHSCRIPAMTEVRLQTTHDVDSASAKIGDLVELRLVEPLIIDGQLILPSGIVGTGEVIHAAPASRSGKAGELILAARYLDYQGSNIPLRSFRVVSAGAKSTGQTFVTGMGSALVTTYYSENTKIVQGTTATAKISAEVAVSC